MKIAANRESWRNFGKKAVLNCRKICDSWNMLKFSPPLSLHCHSIIIYFRHA